MSLRWSSRSGPVENQDFLQFKREDCIRHFELLEKDTEEIAGAASKQDLLSIANPKLPQPLLNFRTILICERLRQLGSYNTAQEVLGLCRNPALVDAWTAWADYLAAKKPYSSD
jgi:hypothetical protein